MKKKAIIVSGYFNPIHKGHIEYFINAKAMADELFVIVNNDHQRSLKGSKEFQNENERMIIVSNIKSVDQVILSIDKDRTVCETIRTVAEKYGHKYNLAFANGGDQNNDTIPEKLVCEEMNVKLIDGLGDKIQSSSWLLDNAEKQKDQNFYNKVIELVSKEGFEIVDQNLQKPWGAYLVINEKQTQSFINTFFDNSNLKDLEIGRKLSPKILIVKPGKRLSWQYHNRRSEIWQIYKGEVGIVKSETNTESVVKKYKKGDQVNIEKGIRHRLIGLQDYGVVAEIWQHQEDTPSDEYDIVRVQDDFGR